VTKEDQHVADAQKQIVSAQATQKDSTLSFEAKTMPQRLKSTGDSAQKTRADHNLQMAN